ncbi:hypothetical protein Rai3103_14535 [Raineyella fluvialis]|uniref:PAC2 family protein n=1 Tax=Raineyella fluvialis TaxID=2662261 RepID=A0A5Q2FCY6_9ACTN|nr:hypothetical protein Rai3103_14535 [Raineyella fluvialis]
MSQSTPLFTYESHIDPRRVRAATLVVTLGGFVDAGHTQRLVDHQVLEGLESHRVGAFDADVLVDHRAERPGITFAGDRFTDYEPPQLTLLQATDINGVPFLLLRGPNRTSVGRSSPPPSSAWSTTTPCEPLSLCRAFRCPPLTPGLSTSRGGPPAPS